MFRQFIIFLICVLHSTIYTKNLGNNLNGYGNQFWPRSAPSFSPTQADYGSGPATIHVYYETLCPDCTAFLPRDLMQTVIELGPLLKTHLYPYGNAQTIPNGYGRYEFISQHGPEETYGNKLHACAIDVLQNMTLATLFNSCLMDSSHSGKGSDDAAADKCGALLHVNPGAIKQCAKSSRGSYLLKYFGDESKKVGIKSVPTIFVNGVPSSCQRFRQDVYTALSLNRKQPFRGLSE